MATRLAPGTFPTDRPPSHTRLEFPLTYWNSLGALAAVGLVLALHVTSSIRQPAVARVLAAAALPAVAVCLYFTFSRGGSIAAVFGVAVYLVLGYSRGFVPAFIAVVPTTAFALQRAFDADLLPPGARFEQPVAAAQRGDLLTVVVACALAAGLLRGVAAAHGSPAGADRALTPRAAGRQARRRLARRVHRRRRRGGRRARACRASSATR